MKTLKFEKGGGVMSPHLLWWRRPWQGESHRYLHKIKQTVVIAVPLHRAGDGASSPGGLREPSAPSPPG